MRVLIDGVGEQAALIESDIAWGRADQAADGMALHIFAHIKPQEFDTESHGELTRGFRLACPRGAGEQVRSNRLIGVTQPGPGHLHGGGKLFDGLVLTEHGGGEIGFQLSERLGIRF